MTKRITPGVLLAELECEAGTLRLATNNDGTELRDVWPQVELSPEAWLQLAMAAEEFTTKEGTDR